MIRLVVYAKCGYRIINNVSLPCKIVFISPIRKTGICEIWSWCSTSENFMLLIEKLLDNGFLPLALASLKGDLLSFEKLSLSTDEILELGSKNLTLTGEIVGKYFFRESIFRLFESISIERFYVNFKSKTIILKLKKPIKMSILYDNIIRLIKPYIIPPKP